MKRVPAGGHKRVWFFREIDSHRRRPHPRCFGYRCQLQQSNGTRTTNNAFTAILSSGMRAALSIKICFMREKSFLSDGAMRNGTMDLKLFSIGRYTLINAAAGNRELFVTESDMRAATSICSN